jgi:putative addiction module component (TIGR02574 family)
MASSLLDEIRKLSLGERIQLVEDVWDSIAAESASGSCSRNLPTHGS